MKDEYRIRVTRPNAGSGTQDPETGVYAGAGADRVLLDCPANVQDSGESVNRNASGAPVKVANATIVVPKPYRDDLLACEPHDVVTVWYPRSDRIAEGNVDEVREFDNVLTAVYR